MRYGWLVLTVLIGFGCAPRPESISHEVTQLPSGPRLDDVDLKFDEKAPVTSDISFSSDVSAAVVFRLSENLLSVGGGLSGGDRAAWINAILAGLPHDMMSIADPNSDYARLLVAQSRKLAQESLDGILPQLKGAPARIRAILKGLKAPLGPKETTDFPGAVKKAFAYLRAFDQAVEKSDLLTQIKGPVRAGIAREVALEGSLKADANRIENTKSIRATIAAVEGALGHLDMPLDSAQARKLEKARKLGMKVDSFQDSQGALSMLIDVWVFLDPTSRRNIFQSASADLYDYLSGMNAEDLQCLQSPECYNLPKWIAKKMVILPKIEEYGLENIRSKVNSSGADSVREEVLTSVLAKVRELPRLAGDIIETKINASIAPVLALQNDFEGAMLGRLAKWAKATVEKNGPSVYRAHPAKAHLEMKPNGTVRLSWTEIPADTMENTGALSAIWPIFWRELSLGEDKARSIAISEVSSLAKDYQDVQARKITPIASARAYAELIRGLSNLALGYRENEVTSFDSLLGGFRAQELFPEFKADPLNQALFPKDAFFALSFGSLATNLKATTSDRTQVFLIDSKNRVTLANEPPSEDDAQLVMAGIADRRGDTLSPTVRSEDVARYLLAMCQVLDSTRDIENSKSPYLTVKGSDGQVPRDEIVQSRDKMRILILGLANYLSHQFRSGGELIRRELVIATQQPYDLTVTVMDQLLAIRALIAAADALGVDLYRWEAVDLVSALNRNLYRPELGFYARPDEASVSPLVLAEGLRALEAVSPYLKPFSRAQVERIASVWRPKLAIWKIQN